MNVFVLLVLCIFLFAICLFAEGQDILSPAVLTVASYLLMALVCFLRNGFSNIDIQINTLLLFITVLSVFLYFYFGTKYLITRKRLPIFEYKALSIIPKLSTLYLMYIFSFFGLFYQWKSATTLTGKPFLSNPVEVMTRMHNIVTYTNYERNYIANIFSYFIEISGYYISFFLLTKRKFLADNSKKRKIAFRILLLFFLSKIISGGRTWLIKYFIVCSIYYFYINKTTYKNNAIRIIKKSCLLIFIFLMSFGLMGLLTSKVTKFNFDLIYGYSGGALIAFDYKFNNENLFYVNDDRPPGAGTFNGFYRFLVSLHIIPEYLSKSKKFVYVDIGDNATTNIFTSLSPYFTDFGILGIVFIQAFIAILACFLYEKIKRKGYNCSPMYYFFYGVIIYGIMMQGIGAEITAKTIDFENVFCYIFLWIIIKMNKYSIVLYKK